MDCFGTYFNHVQTCANVRVQNATQWTASVHTLTISKPALTVVFKVLRNRLLRYIQSIASVHTLTMSKPVITFMFKVLRNQLLRYIESTAWVYFNHVQTCDNVRVQNATQWTASVHTLTISKPALTFVFKMLRNGLLRYNFTHVQTCDNVCVQSPTQWTASVHTLHMSKPVILFAFKALGNGLLRYMFFTCPDL